MAESYAGSVGDVADRYGLSKTQVFTWRREARTKFPAPVEPSFVPVVVESAPITGDDRAVIYGALLWMADIWGNRGSRRSVLQVCRDAFVDGADAGVASRFVPNGFLLR